MCVCTWYILVEKTGVESTFTYLQRCPWYIAKFLKASNVYSMILFHQNKAHAKTPCISEG